MISDQCNNTGKKLNKNLHHFRAKWYTVSVTEEEVHRGLLYINNRNDVTYFYRRKFKNPGKYAEEKLARRYMDVQV